MQDYPSISWNLTEGQCGHEMGTYRKGSAVMSRDLPGGAVQLWLGTYQEGQCGYEMGTYQEGKYKVGVKRH